MGRTRKPIQYHQKLGNYRADRHGDIEKVPKTEPLMKAPSPPHHLNRWGKLEWNRLCNNMIEMELLEDIDLGLVEQASIFYGIFRSVSIDLSKQPNLFKYFEGKSTTSNTIMQTLNTTYRNYSEIVYKLGVSPIERQKIQIEKKNLTENPFEVISSKQAK